MNYVLVPAYKAAKKMLYLLDDCIILILLSELVDTNAGSAVAQW